VALAVAVRVLITQLARLPEPQTLVAVVVVEETLSGSLVVREL
jgi:hypothetical protein